MAKQTKQIRRLPWGDSYLNLIVGVIVVLAIGAVIIGIIRSRATVQSPGGQTNEEAGTTQTQVLPMKHTVTAGEDLWKISEKYYKTGYNWVDIAAENKLDNPNAIAEGMELSIPDVAPRVTQAPEQMVETSPSPSEEVTISTPTTSPTVVPTTIPTVAPTTTPAEEKISGDSYKVVTGDSLWNIAVRAYGDGYKWVDIARANKLANPDVIHPGNTFNLPR